MPLDYEAALAEARRFRGGLGAVSWAVVKALRAAGAPEKDVKAALDLMVAEFPKLDDADCEVLCRALFARMEEERAKNPDGRWY